MSSIIGGAGGGAYDIGGLGGAGLINANEIKTLTNHGQIDGGRGGGAGFGGEGGADVINNQGATIGSLINASTGSIGGGLAGGAPRSVGGPGGAGVSNSGAITSLINWGTIGGGDGGSSARRGGTGGAAVSNAGMITTMTNRRKVIGGTGGTGSSLGGRGGAALSNAGTVTTLTNSGSIAGGAGGGRAPFGGTGGAGVANSGTIGTLANSGVIAGGAGGAGPAPGAAGDAIYSAGANASIGPITYSGEIIGNVEIDNQANVTVHGGTGKTFGRWTGGTITIGNGDLTFARGNTTLGDNVVAGTVYNDDPLLVTSPIAITGNYDQSGTGELDFLLSSATDPTQYQLSVTGSTALGGGLGVDLASGFHLAAGDAFDLLQSGGALSGGFSGFSLDGAACSGSPDVWRCGGFVFDVSIVTGAPGSVDLSVASSAVPEPATWAMLGAGFLGLSALALRRQRALAA